MSSILVLQRRNDYVKVMSNFIDAPVLDKAYMEMKDILSFDKSMNPTLAVSVKDVLKVNSCFKYRIVERCMVVDINHLSYICFIIFTKVRLD